MSMCIVAKTNVAGRVLHMTVSEDNNKPEVPTGP